MWLGVTAFDGPAAHIALMEEQCVRRRQWISHERFIDVLGAANLIPGPTSTELAMHIGLARAGWPGLVLAGVTFITPAALMVSVVAAVYVNVGVLPAVNGVLRTIKPVVVVVVLVAMIAIARAALRSRSTVLVAIGAAILMLTGVHEIEVLLLAGVVKALASYRPENSRGARPWWIC